MKRNITLNLPNDLIARTRAYAAAHGTTMTQIIQTHLETITAEQQSAEKTALELYSEGSLGTREACRALGLRDGAELLIALSEHGLPFPLPSPHVIEGQADTFARLWRDLP